MTFVKICGITNLYDARCAADAGADLLGFIFYPRSPRFVDPEQAGIIMQSIRHEFDENAPRGVGVFVDEPAARVQAVLDGAGLDLAQLHGSEPVELLRALQPRAFKAIRPQTPQEAEDTAATYDRVLPNDESLPQFLIDAYHPRQYGGTGIAADWRVAQPLARRFRLLLAGGLTPDTVRTAVEHVRPWGVDVSSGVERAPGLKDHGGVRSFLEAVRTAEVRTGP